MVIGYVLVGLVAGVAGGMLGIGGGLIIIPALVYIFGFGQHIAQGTTLALMVPPIGIWAAYIYYQKNFIDFQAALFICLAFFLGSYFGAKWAVSIPAPLLKKIFAVFLAAIAVKMFTEK